MNWRPVNIAPHELSFEKAGIVERFHEACARLNVRPVTPDINGGYSGRTAGARVETADGRQLWLRVAGVTSTDNRLLKADIAADTITGVPKPVLVEQSNWVNGNIHWTARLVTLADTAIEVNPWAGPSAASVTDDWIGELKQALDGLGSKTSAQIHVSPEALQKWLSDTNQIEHEFPQSEWRLSHNDLNWSNLTAPKLSILDWEWHGLSPTGFDPGLLIAYSCRNEELVRRLERAFEPYFETFTGRVARAFATDQLRSAAAGGWLDPAMLRHLDAMLERLNSQVLLAYHNTEKRSRKTVSTADTGLGLDVATGHAGHGMDAAVDGYKIAAVIPLYNGASYIRTALESVLAQERKADEIIVVDDGSTDSGPSIVASMAAANPTIRLLSKKNGGQGSARNFGVRHSAADLIAFLDQDDIWYADHLTELEKPFLRKSRLPLGWTYSNLDEINGNGRMVCHSVLDTQKNEHPKRTLQCCLQQDMFILPVASLISRDAFDAVGGFDEQFMGYEDDDLFLRMFCRGYRSVYIDQPLTIWRIHTASTSYGKLMAQSRMKYFSKLVATFPDEPELHRFFARQFFAPRFVRSVLADLRSGITLDNHERVVIACSHLWELSGHLSMRQKIPLRMLAILARFPMAGRLARRLPDGAANGVRSVFGV